VAPFLQTKAREVPVPESIAPGRCVDCGSDAYIRLTTQSGKPNGDEEWLCAHCYSQRMRAHRAARAEPATTEPTKTETPPAETADRELERAAE
jgi:hypothetical protein